MVAGHTLHLPARRNGKPKSSAQKLNISMPNSQQSLTLYAAMKRIHYSMAGNRWQNGSSQMSLTAWLHSGCRCADSRIQLKVEPLCTGIWNEPYKCSVPHRSDSRAVLPFHRISTVPRHRSPFTLPTIIISKLNVTPTRDTITNIFHRCAALQRRLNA